MSVNLTQFLARLTALASIGLLTASLAVGQTVPPSPPDDSDDAADVSSEATDVATDDPSATGRDTDNAGDDTAPKGPAGASGSTSGDTTRRSTATDRATPGTRASGTGAGRSTSDNDNSLPSSRPSSRDDEEFGGTSRGGRNVADEDDGPTALGNRRQAGSSSLRDDDSASDTDASDRTDRTRFSREERSDSDLQDSQRGRRTPARDTADDFRDAAEDTRRDARDTADGFRDSTRDTLRDARRSESRAGGDFRVENFRSADMGIWFDRSSDEGLIISDIGTQGSITRLGLREGDRIYSVNGQRVGTEQQFIDTLYAPNLRNQRVEVMFYRLGRPWSVQVQPSVFVQEYTNYQTDPLDTYGLYLDDRYDDYVVVGRVTPRSPAFYAGLRPGDVLVNFQGQRLNGRNDLGRLIGQGNWDSVAFDVRRNRQLRRLNMDLSRVNRANIRTSLRPNLDGSDRLNRRGSIDGRSRTTIDGGLDADAESGIDGIDSRSIDSRSNATGRLDANADATGRLDADADATGRFDNTGDATGRFDNTGDATGRFEAGGRGDLRSGRNNRSVSPGTGSGANATDRTGVGGSARGGLDGSINPGINEGLRGSATGGVRGSATGGVRGGTRGGVQGGTQSSGRSGGLFPGRRAP